MLIIEPVSHPKTRTKCTDKRQCTPLKELKLVVAHIDPCSKACAAIFHVPGDQHGPTKNYAACKWIPPKQVEAASPGCNVIKPGMVVHSQSWVDLDHNGISFHWKIARMDRRHRCVAGQVFVAGRTWKNLQSQIFANEGQHILKHHPLRQTKSNVWLWPSTVMWRCQNTLS